MTHVCSHMAIPLLLWKDFLAGYPTRLACHTRTIYESFWTINKSSLWNMQNWFEQSHNLSSIPSGRRGWIHHHTDSGSNHTSQSQSVYRAGPWIYNLGCTQSHHTEKEKMRWCVTFIRISSIIIPNQLQKLTGKVTLWQMHKMSSRQFSLMYISL